MGIFWEIAVRLSRVAMDGLWGLMSSAWVGYWLPSICGAAFGWFGHGKYPTMKRVWVTLRDGLAGVALAFVLVFAYEFTVAVIHFWNPNMVIAIPKPLVPPSAPEGSQVKQVNTLKQRTLNLANDLYDWAVEQEGPINSWKQQAVAQAFIDAMRNNPAGAAEFHQRRSTTVLGASERFSSFYWPRILTLQDELRSVGVDTTPLSHAEASNDPPRAISVILSVLARRVGEKGPFRREITPLEMTLLNQQVNVPNIQIYAYMPDANSKEVAETLRAGFSRHKGLLVNPQLYPLEASAQMRHGIWLVYPSADFTSELNGFIPAFEACQLENTWEIRPMKQPPSILKIEVWPETPGWKPMEGPNLIR